MSIRRAPVGPAPAKIRHTSAGGSAGTGGCVLTDDPRLAVSAALATARGRGYGSRERRRGGGHARHALIQIEILTAGRALRSRKLLLQLLQRDRQHTRAADEAGLGHAGVVRGGVGAQAWTGVGAAA